MNSILATEPAAVATDEKRSTLPPLETWATNERMRHVPSADWMARKVETDIRKRVDKVMPVLLSVPNADPRHASLETEFRSLCKALERLADAARPTARQNGHDLPSRIDSMLTIAAANLHSLEPTAFGRRNPYHSFDRSKAEPVYASLLAVFAHLERVITLVRAIEPGIDERLQEGLVILQNPVDDRMLRPIA
jgi:hypothetical protein